jgi:protein-disulfide isomerase
MDSESGTKKVILSWTVLGVVIAAFITGAFIHNERNVQAQRATDENTPTVRQINGSDHVIGSRTAPVQVFVYTDFSCPNCMSYHYSAMPRLIKEFGDDIAIVYRHFPLTYLHPTAYREAVASECVYQYGGDEAFWVYANLLFSVPQLEAGASESDMVSMAQKLGISPADFSACLADTSKEARVQQDILEGTVFGVNKTPSVVVASKLSQVLISGATGRLTSAAILAQQAALRTQ